MVLTRRFLQNPQLWQEPSSAVQIETCHSSAYFLVLCVLFIIRHSSRAHVRGVTCPCIVCSRGLSLSRRQEAQIFWGTVRVTANDGTGTVLYWSHTSGKFAARVRCWIESAGVALLVSQAEVDLNFEARHFNWSLQQHMQPMERWSASFRICGWG